MLRGNTEEVVSRKDFPSFQAPKLDIAFLFSFFSLLNILTGKVTQTSDYVTLQVYGKYSFAKWFER